jgi:hypothetical protein
MTRSYHAIGASAVDVDGSKKAAPKKQASTQTQYPPAVSAETDACCAQARQVIKAAQEMATLVFKHPTNHGLLQRQVRAVRQKATANLGLPATVTSAAATAALFGCWVSLKDISDS